MFFILEHTSKLWTSFTPIASLWASQMTQSSPSSILTLAQPYAAIIVKSHPPPQYGEWVGQSGAIDTLLPAWDGAFDRSWFSRAVFFCASWAIYSHCSFVETDHDRSGKFWKGGVSVFWQQESQSPVLWCSSRKLELCCSQRGYLPHFRGRWLLKSSGSLILQVYLYWKIGPCKKKVKMTVHVYGHWSSVSFVARMSLPNPPAHWAIPCSMYTFLGHLWI